MSTARSGHTRALIVALAIVLAAVLVWGLGPAAADSTSPSPDAGKIVLHMGWTNDPDNLNPFIGYESSSYEIWALNYELLVGFRASDMSNQPGLGLATAWETSPDGLVWTFTITDKAKWHDGVPLTAADVAFTYNYVLENELGMFIDYLAFIDKIEATDATHVVFTCSKPKANMLGLWIPILPEHIWSKIDPAEVEDKFRNDPPIVGSGPFQCVEWKKGSYVKMVANKGYWKGAPKIDEIVFQTYQNQDTIAQDLIAGTLDAAWNVPAAQFDKLDANPDIVAIKGRLPGLDELGFNCADKKQYPKSTGHPVLTDPAFRSALQWAVDKEKIASIAYAGNATAAATLVQSDFYPPEADYHWEPPAGDPATYVFDLEKAKSALDAAGYTDGDGNGIREYKGKDIKLRLYARTESTESQSAGKLLAGWFKDIGLDIDFQVIDDGRLGDLQFAYDKDDNYAPDFDMFIWGWGGDIDPNFILSVMTTSSIEAWSDCVWSNAEYDELFLEQQTQLDLAERVASVQRMQQIIYEESPYIPLVYPIELEAYNTTDWEGWVRSSSGLVWYSTLPDTYLALQPKVAAVEEGGGSRTALIAGLVAAVAAVLVVVVVVLQRRGGRRETEV